MTGRLGGPIRGKLAALAVALALVACGVWLAVAAAGGTTTVNAGHDQFYPGPVCRVSPAAPSAGEGCPHLPTSPRGSGHPPHARSS